MAEPHELRLRVRYAETDQMGIAHHAGYLVWMEEGRTALMRSLGFPYEDVEARGYAMGVRQLEVRYRQAARYGDEVLVRTTVERFRGASILYGYELLRAADGELLATGSVEVVCLRQGELRPTPIPADIRAALEGRRGQRVPTAPPAGQAPAGRTPASPTQRRARAQG